jgi:membrane protein YqaA with SNARE-associated domain
MSKYKYYFDRYGGYSLLLSWMPLIGDPITFMAGVLNYNFKYFLVLVLIAKLGRYTLLVLGVLLFK